MSSPVRLGHAAIYGYHVSEPVGWESGKRNVQMKFHQAHPMHGREPVRPGID